MSFNIEKKQYTVVLDIDETLLNPLEKYKTVLNTFLGVQISVRDIELNGGLDNLFCNLSIYNEFCKIADNLRASSEFNSDLPAIDNSVEYLQKILNITNVISLFYLTTRPDSVLSVTKENLIKVGFPIGEIVARPSDVRRTDTAIWKQSVLEEYSKNFDGDIIFIDDNIPTAKQIYTRNKEVSQKKIHMVLFGGPITYVQIMKENIKSEYENYFYVADDWEHIYKISREIIIKKGGATDDEV
jgi:hypothetical protein